MGCVQEDVRALQGEKAALEADLQEATERAEVAAAQLAAERERGVTLERARAAAVQAILPGFSSGRNIGVCRQGASSECRLVPVLQLRCHV